MPGFFTSIHYRKSLEIKDDVLKCVLHHTKAEHCGIGFKAGRHFKENVLELSLCILSQEAY